jgi:hypothetical protein
MGAVAQAQFLFVGTLRLAEQPGSRNLDQIRVGHHLDHRRPLVGERLAQGLVEH